MSSASAVRLQLESALAHRIPSALTPAPRVICPVARVGIAAVDELLHGGLPIGAITEIVGPESSGRTSLSLSFLAQTTEAGKVCAWVDVTSALHPESAAAAGVDLSRLLWVRCGVPPIGQPHPAPASSFTIPKAYLAPPLIKKGLHGGVRYAKAYDREVLDLFTAIRHHVELDQAGRLLSQNNQRHIKSAREMAKLFRDVPYAVENTVELSSRLKFELDDLGYEFPRYPVPDGETMDSFLAKRVADGVMRRYWPKGDRALLEKAKKQVEHELALIARLGFAGYFLIVWDIIDFCKRNGILVQGRGSAANSAVCYALEIMAIQVSEWACSIEHDSNGSLSLRLGMGYARGLRGQVGSAIVMSRFRDGRFNSADDLAMRVPELNRKELTLLARIGALNNLDGIDHRRDALWQVGRAGRPEGPLLMQNREALRDDAEPIPLAQLNVEERLVADYAGTGLTIGKHPMFYRREELRRQKVLSALELKDCRDGQFVRAAGCVIARQRPGTAKGFIFISMEDETGIANVIVVPDLYERERLVVTRSKFLLVEGKLQNQDGVVHVKASRLIALSDRALELSSHDFH